MKRITIASLLISLFVHCISTAAMAQSTVIEPNRVLLIYDSLAIGSSKEGNVEQLQRLLSAFNVEVTLGMLEDYSKDTLKQYGKVITIFNSSDSSTNQDYIDDINDYRGGHLHIGMHISQRLQKELGLHTQLVHKENVILNVGQFMEESIKVNEMLYITHSTGVSYGEMISFGFQLPSPYAVMEQQLAFVPYFEKGNLSVLALAYVLHDWFGFKKQGQAYIVFKEVYPFSDLALLKLLSDKLYDAGIPFIVSVRPLFSNTDYPATLRYLEMLKYVQSKNGSILVNAPVVAPTISQLGRDLGNQMASFIDTLIEYGIAPLGVGAEMYWSYDQQLATNGLSFFDSAILFENIKPMFKSQVPTSQPFSSSMYSMQLAELQPFHYSDVLINNLPLDIAITFDFFDNESELNEAVRLIMASWITFADYKYKPHSVITDKNKVISKNGQLFINGDVVSLNTALSNVVSTFAYKQGQDKSMESLFNIQNKIFIIIIIIALIVFSGFLIIGYREYRKKYYH